MTTPAPDAAGTLHVAAAGVPPDASERAGLQRRTLAVLVASEVPVGGAVGASAATGTLLARDVLGGGTLAGLAFAAFALGSALWALPLSRLMATRGRRPGLLASYAAGTAGAAAAVAAAEVRSFPLVLVGMAMLGMGSAGGFQARYAGADLAEPHHRGRSISLVVWATTVGAVAGPNLLGPTGHLAASAGLPRLAGPFLVASACFATAFAVVAAGLRPDPLVAAGLAGAPGGETSVRHLLAGVARNRPAAAALATMVVAHAVMVSVMTMTPLHLRDHGDSLTVIGVVVSGHITGMYVLAPAVGALVDRVGGAAVGRLAAAVLVLAPALAAASGHDHLAIGIALALLGVGWSLATISGSTVMTASARPADRARVQGAADLAMGLGGATAGTVGGLVVGTVGYGPLSLAAAAMAGAVLLVTVARRPVPATVA